MTPVRSYDENQAAAVRLVCVVCGRVVYSTRATSDTCARCSGVSGIGIVEHVSERRQVAPAARGDV